MFVLLSLFFMELLNQFPFLHNFLLLFFYQKHVFTEILFVFIQFCQILKVFYFIYLLFSIVNIISITQFMERLIQFMYLALKFIYFFLIYFLFLEPLLAIFYGGLYILIHFILYRIESTLFGNLFPFLQLFLILFQDSF